MKGGNDFVNVGEPFKGTKNHAVLDLIIILHFNLKHVNQIEQNYF